MCSEQPLPASLQSQLLPGVDPVNSACYHLTVHYQLHKDEGQSRKPELRPCSNRPLSLGFELHGGHNAPSAVHLFFKHPPASLSRVYGRQTTPLHRQDIFLHVAGASSGRTRHLELVIGRYLDELYQGIPREAWVRAQKDLDYENWHVWLEDIRRIVHERSFYPLQNI